jgi:hypothetical protein
VLIAFISASVFFGLFISYIWSSNGALNVLIKTAVTGYTMWGVVIWLILMWKYFEPHMGNMRLI